MVIHLTRSSGTYGPFLVTTAEGIGGPFRPSLKGFHITLLGNNFVAKKQPKKSASVEERRKMYALRGKNKKTATRLDH